MAKAPVKKKPITKTEMLGNIAEATELSKKEVAAVLDAMGEEIKKALSSRGAGAIAIPGLVKITKKKIPATKARKMPRPGNPNEIIDVPAKPARTKVQVRALKGLKDML